MTGYHRHAFDGGAAHTDGHSGPCETPVPVLILDPRDMAGIKQLQRAVDQQRSPGLQGMVNAVTALCEERVS